MEALCIVLNKRSKRLFSSNVTWVKLKWFSVLPRTVIINLKTEKKSEISLSTQKISSLDI